jgi:hypothetical protein
MALKTINFEAALEAVKAVDGEQAKQLCDHCKARLDALGEPVNRRARGKTTGHEKSTNINVRSIMAWIDSIERPGDGADPATHEEYTIAVARLQTLHARLAARG